MTPEDLKAWQDSMGWSGLEAARQLGVSSATYRDWLSGVSRTTGKPVKVSRMAALACAALAAGLGPWGAKKEQA